ncbi:MAG: hypothetical protein V4754_13660 [Pseudomonadota bacterium]
MNPAPATEGAGDFFSRMVQKALAADGLIAPRLPSLFEAAPGLPQGAAPAWRQATPQVGEREHGSRPAAPEAVPAGQGRPRARAPDPAAPPPAAEAGLALPARRTAALLAPARQAPWAADPDDIAAPEPVLPEPGRAAHAPPTARPGRRAAADLGAGLPPAVLLPAASPSARTLAGLPAPGPQAPASGPLAPTPTLSHADAPRASGVLLPPAPRPSPQPAAGPALAPPTPSVSPSATRAAERSAPWNEPALAPAAPVINVTIGRIEVRAMPPPAGPGRPRAAAVQAAPLSLDDYLKRGGGRP